MRQQFHRARHLSAVTLCAIVALIAVSQSVAAQTLDDARRFLDTGRSSEARAMLERIVSRSSDDPDALALLARATFDGAQSQELYRQALNSSPSGDMAPTALLAIADFYYAIGFYSNSHRLAQRVIDEFPGSDEASTAQLLVGRATLASGMPYDAASTLEPLFDSDDEHVRHGATLVWAEAMLSIDRDEAVVSVLSDPGWWSDPYAMGQLTRAYKSLNQDRDEQNTRWRGTLARRAWRAERLSSVTRNVPRSRAPVVVADTTAGDLPPVMERQVTSSVEGEYSLQIGAFSTERYADRLVSRMRDAGYVVNIKRTGSMNRVLVGMYADRDEARADMDSVRAKSGQDAVIVRNR
jgi:tetratricopeptide (TPR) repeat protein